VVNFGPDTVDRQKLLAETAAKRKLPEGRAYVAVPLRREGDFFLTEVKINGQTAGTFLVDTGAAATAVTKEVAENLKLPDDDKPEVQYMAATGCGRHLMQMPEKGAGQGNADEPATPEGSPQKIGSIKVLGQTLEGLAAITGRSDDVYITSDPRQAGVVGGHI